MWLLALAAGCAPRRRPGGPRPSRCSSPTTPRRSIRGTRPTRWACARRASCTRGSCGSTRTRSRRGPTCARGWRWRDPLTLEVELRDDVRFHSGAPLRARDVVATLRAFASPAVASRHARVVEAIAEAREGRRPRGGRPPGAPARDAAHRSRAAHPARGPGDVAPRARRLARRPRPFLGGARGARRRASRAGRGRRACPARRTPSRFAPCTTRTRARCGSRPAAPTSRVNLVSPTLLPRSAREPASRSRRAPARTSPTSSSTRTRAARRRARAARAVRRDRSRHDLRDALDGRAQPAGGLIAPAHWAHTDAPPLPFDPAGEARASRGPEQRACASRSSRRPSACAATSRASSRRSWATWGSRRTSSPLELGTMLARLDAGDFDLGGPPAPGDDRAERASRVFLHSRSSRRPAPTAAACATPRSTRSSTRATRTPGSESRRAIYARVEAREREAMHWLPLWYEDQVAVTSDARPLVRPERGGPMALARAHPVKSRGEFSL